MSNNDQFSLIQEKEAKLNIEKALLLEKALKSDNVNDIYRAQRYLQNIKKKQEVDSKAMVVDPFSTNVSQGYREKPFQLSFELLRAMSRTHVIKSIISTRRGQVKSFCQPQKNEYSTGFVIEKKRSFRSLSKPTSLEKEDEKRLDELYEFLLNCGSIDNYWHSDNFETFVGKLVEDSLSIDQGCGEIVRDIKGTPVEFFAVDGASIRIADQLDEKYKDKDAMQRGYQVSHIQIYQGNVVAEFYPWELMFGVRNPSTSLRTNGYGRSELEDMVQTVTALLNADTYNANFFKVGSAPKGLLKYSGNINQNTVEEFRRQWISEMAGVMNMHKIPIINADKMDFVNLQQSNKDMEFSSYQEFLIKISCALFSIDPSEIGFPMNGSSNVQPMFEGNNEARLKYSRDKGLKPLLKDIQNWINKWIIHQIAPDFEFRFVGIEEKDEQTDFDRDIQSMANFMTINELRKKRNLQPLDGMDIIANPIAYQAIVQQQQQEMMEEQGQEENPFMKSLNTELERILNTEL